MFTFFRVAVTIILEAALLIAARFLRPDLSVIRLGTVPFVDIITAVAALFLFWFIISPFICRFLRSVRFRFSVLRKIKKQIRIRQRSLLNWLLSRAAHWGITGTATEIQYANTCEALLALRAAGYHEIKRESYRSALQALTEAVVPTGLPSRTVNRPTVINTSMLLCLIALEKQQSTGVIEDFEFYDEMAANLWFLHADDGWGPLILKAARKEARMVNTWWALNALLQYGYLENKEESESFRQLITGIYEKNRGGTFGYSASDSPRLTVTAMYLLLYYDLPSSVRNEIRKDYDPSEAAAFIFRRFTVEKCQVEVESIDGTYAGGTFIAHTPWKHIASAYAMRAFAAAYKNGDLPRKKLDDVYRRISEILSNDLRSPAVNESCYIPSDIEVPRTGPYTFAAAHLITGLQALK